MEIEGRERGSKRELGERGERGGRWKWETEEKGEEEGGGGKR